MALFRTHMAHIYMSIICGWIGYAVINSAIMTHELQHARAIIAHSPVTQIPHNLEALITDIMSEEMPPSIACEDTLAADVLDTHIMLGDELYELTPDIQQFIMAHEMAHYREHHHTYDIVCQSFVLPIGIIIVLVCIMCTIHTRWAVNVYACMTCVHRGISRICTRTLALHTPYVRNISYRIMFLTVYCAISISTGIACGFIHAYIATGLTQYTEYRADINAVCTTHDTDAPYRLFSDDTRAPTTHPSDHHRRLYIDDCQSRGFTFHTWCDIIRLLNTQHICGAIMYHILQHLPTSYIMEICREAACCIDDYFLSYIPDYFVYT